MKTKELIAQLQALDPDGNLEVVIGGSAVYFAERLPGYYDGSYEEHTYDESKKGFKIVKITRKRSGYKIRLTTYSVEDAIWDSWDKGSGGFIEIDNSEMPSYDADDETLRKEVKEYVATLSDEMKAAKEKIKKQ